MGQAGFSYCGRCVPELASCVEGEEGAVGVTEVEADALAGVSSDVRYFGALT